MKQLLYAAVLAAAASFPALADHWAKTFTVSAAPELRVETNDANVTVRAANVSAIQADVYTTGWRIGPGDISVTDHQMGNTVEINVKVPPFHFNLGNRSVRLEIQVPNATKADIHTGDGNIRAEGLHGPARLVTHDGNIEGEGFDGALEATSGDGNIRIHGRFDSLNLRSGDGNIDAEVRPGSRPAGAWTIHSGDGGVTLRLPEGLAVDFEAHTGDGKITIDLPMTTSGPVQSHSVTGKLNGGGPLLTIHTGDGSIHLERW
jgi:Toastrack DUF4097